MRFWMIPEFRQATTPVFPEGKYKELRSLHLHLPSVYHSRGITARTEHASNINYT